MFPRVPGAGELSGPANRRSRLMRRGTVVRGARPAAVLIAAGIVVAWALPPAIAGTARSRAPALVRVSSDPITKAGQEHATEAEPDTIAVGNKVLSSFMVGNVPTCTDDIGWAFSSDGGKTWTHGLLPGLTRYSNPPGPEPSVADTTAAWDARYKEWVVSALNCANPGGVTVSISKDGTHWSKPISVFKGTGRDISDKDWVTCDSHPASPHYGNCYAEWDMVNKGFQVEMSTSTDGGKTWSAPVATASKFRGVGGEPVVEPNGTVVVPIPTLHGLVLHDGNLDVFTSTNGGRNWGADKGITTFHQHSLTGNLGNLRLPFFPTEGMDHAGRLYLAFPDCRFRAKCASDDMVMTTSTDGTHWTAVTRIPIAPVTSTVDVWGGGLAVDPSTSGTSARLGLYYYYFPKLPCTVSTCRVFLGYTSSANGGAAWSTPKVIAGPMKLTQFGDSFPGVHDGGFAGDYVGASAIPGGNAVAVLPLGLPATTQKFNEPMEAVKGGEPITTGR